MEKDNTTIKVPVIISNSSAYSLPFSYLPVTITRFADGEIRPYVDVNITEKSVFYICSMYEVPSDVVMEWILTIDAIKRKNPKSITAIIPYMPYIRQSKVHRDGESKSAEVVAKILSSSGVDQIITFDFHNESALSFFSISVTHLSAVLLLPEIFQVDDNTIVVSPDQGSANRARKAAELLHVPLVVLEKTRSYVNGDTVETMQIHDDVSGKRAIIVDDIISTGTTIVRATKLLREHHIARVEVFGVHAVFADHAKQLFDDATIDRIVVTDTIPKDIQDLPKQTEIVSIGTLLEQAIRDTIKP